MGTDGMPLFGVSMTSPGKIPFLPEPAHPARCPTRQKAPDVTERTPSAMPSKMPTLLHFEGGNALAPHQVQALLPKLQAINPRISGVHARFVHWVALDQALPSGALDKLAALMRERFKLQGDVRVKSSEGRMSAWILCLLPFGMGALMTFLNPEVTSLLWTDPSGRAWLTRLVVLMAVGIFWITRIVRIKA